MENIIGALIIPKAQDEPQKMQFFDLYNEVKVCDLCKIIYKLYEKKKELDKVNEVKENKLVC